MMIPIEAARGLKYNYAHLALPILVLMNPQKSYQDLSARNGKDYLNSMWQGLAGRMGIRQPDGEIGSSMIKLCDDVEVYIIEPPRPTEVLDAFFIAAVFCLKKRFLRREVKRVRYFTLELGRNPSNRSDEFHLCEWTGSILSSRQHLNYGRIADPSKQAFVTAMSHVLRKEKLDEGQSLEHQESDRGAENPAHTERPIENERAGIEKTNAGTARLSVPDISDLVQLAKRHRGLLDKHEGTIRDNFNAITEIVHKSYVEFVLEQDVEHKVFPKGVVQAQEYLNQSLSFTLRSLGIAFVLGWEYQEHYRENPKAMLAAQRFDTLTIGDSTQSELKRISDYGAFWIMRLDEMCFFAGYIDKTTLLTGLDTHRSQVQQAVFNGFQDGIISFYLEGIRG